MAKANPAAINRKNRNDGRERRKNFHCDETIRRCSQRGEQDEAKRFAELDHGAEIVGRKIRMENDTADFSPTKQKAKARERSRIRACPSHRSPAPEYLTWLS